MVVAAVAAAAVCVVAVVAIVLAAVAAAAAAAAGVVVVVVVVAAVVVVVVVVVIEVSDKNRSHKAVFRRLRCISWYLKMFLTLSCRVPARRSLSNLGEVLNRLEHPTTARNQTIQLQLRPRNSREAGRAKFQTSGKPTSSLGYAGEGPGGTL